MSIDFRSLSTPDLQQLAREGSKMAGDVLIEQARRDKATLEIGYAYLENESISINDAAEKYGVGITWLHNARNRGRIREVEAGKNGRGNAARLNARDVAVICALREKYPLLPGSPFLKSVYEDKTLAPTV